MNKQASKKSNRYVLFEQLIGLVIHVVQVAILSRLIAPSEFGLVAMAATALTLAQQFKDFGFSVSTIQSENLTEQDQHNLFWLSVSIGLISTIGIFLASPLISVFYGQPEIIWLVLAMGTTYFVSALGTQPIAIAQRKFAFPMLAVWNITAKILGLTVGTALAILGYGVWAIIWLQLSTQVIITCSGFVASRYIPKKWNDIGKTKGHVKFGASLTFAGVINWLGSTADVVLIGKFLGPENLGFYNRAKAIVLIPFKKLLSGFNRLNLASLSRLQNQPTEFNKYLKRMLQLYLSTGILFAALTFAFAQDIVLFLLGTDWLKTIGIFKYLCPYIIFQIICYASNLVLISTANMGHLTKLQVYNFVCSVSIVAIGLPFGIEGTAFSIMLGSITIQTALFLFFAQRIDIVEKHLLSKLFFQNLLMACPVFVVTSLIAAYPISESYLLINISIAAAIATLTLIASLAFSEAGRLLLKDLTGFIQNFRLTH